MFFVYILYSEKYKRTYTGQTENINKRLSQHNTGKNKSTKSYVPWKIIHLEKYATRKEALEREKYLKSSAGRRFIKNKFFTEQ